MKLFVFVISLAFNCAFSDSHVMHAALGCPKNGTVEVFVEVDGDLAGYADFQENTIVLTMPPFIHVDMSPFPDLFRGAVRKRQACEVGQAMAEDFFPNPAPEVQDPPETMLYPADEVQRGVENSLVCFVNHFHPPPIKVTWTINNRPVPRGFSTSSDLLNRDQTFRVFSTLTFIPEHGDVYSCTVEHSALDKPKTRIWGVDLRRSLEDLAFDLYCGLGLTVAFVGFAVLTFLIVHGCYGRRITGYNKKV